MTKQERKEEHKNQEGRPEVKARIKQIQRQISQRQISKVIQNADAVIVNPQHYAVAIKYDTNKAQAPFVIAKGVDDMALYIRKLAIANTLEVLEIPPWRGPFTLPPRSTSKSRHRCMPRWRMC